MAEARKAPTEEAVAERLEREQELSSAAADVDPQAPGEPRGSGTAPPGEGGGRLEEHGGREEAPAEPQADLDAGDGVAVPAPQPAPDAQRAPDVQPSTEAEPVSDAEPEDPLAVAQRERDAYLALAQRTQADFDNWRKRASREAAAASRRAKSGLAGELLPVVDNLERALESATAGESELAGGVRLVHSELISVLGRNGIEPFDPRGEKFDPALHEALTTRAEEGSEPGVVLDVVEKGYRLADSVLRPARVVVSA